MDAMNVLDALGEWSSRPGPLYLRLAESIRVAIERGQLLPGTVLPAERTLAQQLALGRSTVVTAFDRLREQGLLESRQGSGTWVAGDVRGPRGFGQRASLGTAAPAGADQVIDLATASLPPSPLLLEILADLALPMVQAATHSSYTPMGLPELRSAVAESLTSSGLPTTSEQIIVTTGEQQALSLLTSAVLKPGSAAVVEDPTSPGILDLLRAIPAQVRSCRGLAWGGAASVVDAVAQSSAALTYLMPTGRPDGLVPDVAEMSAVAQGLGRLDTVVLEEAGSRDLCFEDPPPLLASLTRSDAFVTIGSMSKLWWNGLRVGWVRAREGLIERLGHDKARADLGSSIPSQVIAHHLFMHEDAIREERLELLTSRLATAEALVTAHLPDLTWTRPRCGSVLWLQMPSGTSTAFTELAARHGVAVVAGSVLSDGGAGDDRLRVAFGRDETELELGIARLGQAWNAYRSRSDDSPARSDRSYLV